MYEHFLQAKSNSLVNESSKKFDASDSCMLSDQCDNDLNNNLEVENCDTSDKVLGIVDNNHHNCNILNQDSCTKDQTIQTKLTMNELCEIFEKLKLSAVTNAQLQSKLNDILLTPDSFYGNDAKTKYFTGLPSFKLLFEIHNIVSPHMSNSQHTALSTFHQLVITLMKLRLNFSFEYFSYR